MSIAAKRYFDRGMAQLASGDPVGAAEQLASAVELVPGWAPASIWLAVAQARRGAIGEAQAAVASALARMPTGVAQGSGADGNHDARWLWILAGDLHLAIGRTRDAGNAYERAAALGHEAPPDHQAARRIALGRARLAAASGDWKTMIGELAAPAL